MPEDTTTPPINPVADSWKSVEGDFQKGLAEAIAEDTRGVPAEVTPPAPPPAKPATSPTTPSTPSRYRLGEEPPPEPLPAPTTPPPPEEDLDAPIPEFKGARAEQWKTIHNRARDFKKRAEEAEAKLQETLAKSIPPDKLTALEKEREAIENELQRVAIERSPRFNQEYQGRFNSLLSGVRALVPPDQRDRVVSLVQAPESTQRTAALEEVLGNLSPLAQRDFADRVVAWNRLSEERSEKIRAASENWRADQEKVERERAAHAEQVRQTFAARQAHFQRSYTATDDQAFNKEVSDAITAARADSEADLAVDKLSDTYIKARMLQPISNLAVKLSEELEAARAEIAALKGAGPSLGAPGSTESEDGTPTSSNVADDLKRYGSVGGAIAADIARMGLRVG